MPTPAPADDPKAPRASSTGPFGQPWFFRTINLLLVIVTVMTVIMCTLMGRDLVHRHEHRVNALQHDLDSLGLRSKIPAIKGISITGRDHRPAITVISFASGQSVTLNASYRWIYVQLPWSQWDQAAALQREGDRRVRAGESSGLTVNDDGTVGQPLGLVATGANAVKAWNAPMADCPWCDSATLADGTTLTIAQHDRLVLIALPLSMLPEVLALPGQPSRAYLTGY